MVVDIIFDGVKEVCVAVEADSETRFDEKVARQAYVPPAASHNCMNVFGE
jgi:hypothetical protein